ncbi:MAG: SUMF1/EgtB/PvdO family nonheme iron enzyme [Planctomycetales bacterium]
MRMTSSMAPPSPRAGRTRNLVKLGMPCCDHCNENSEAGARSMHPGGVNVCFVDGSIRFVSDQIDPSLWHVMHSREIPASAFEPRQFEKDLEGSRWRRSQYLHAVPQNEIKHESGSEITNSLGMRFSRIPAGTFQMGVPNANIGQVLYPREITPHPVRISRSALLGTFEVTQKEFRSVMGTNPSWHTGSNVPSIQNADSHPVDSVTWDEAADFCRKLSARPAESSASRAYRLPTEAEWEYCCRAGRTAAVPLALNWDSQDKSGDMASKHAPKTPLYTSKVGSFPPNPFGLHDMTGNVFEWVHDFHAIDYYAKSPPADPQGPDHGYLHIIRGWHWAAIGPNCKQFAIVEPAERNRFVGFRVVCIQK